MMTREQVKRAGGMLLGAAMLVLLTACGGSAGANTVTPPANPQPAAQPAQAAPAAPGPAQAAQAASAPAQPAVSAAPPANPQPATQPGNKATSDLVARGKPVFEKTAGEVGCAYCHGMDGKGQGVAAVGAPDIRGASESKARNALAGGVPLMGFIKLSDDEITAVVAYLKYLNEQP